MLADCDRCALRDTACAECVITVLPDGQAGLGDEERRALRALARAGLVPPLRFTAAPARDTPARLPARPGPGARRPASYRAAARPRRPRASSHW